MEACVTSWPDSVVSTFWVIDDWGMAHGQGGYRAGLLTRVPHYFRLEGGATITFMQPESGGRFGFSLRGSAGLVVAILVVAVLLIMLPAYRWFFLISVLIGLVIAGGLTLWHRLRPIKEPDVENKRPLGL